MIKLNYPKFWQKQGIVSALLIPFSYIYILLGFIRKIVTKELKLPGFVICVGNISVGGTGKTQICLYLAKKFKAQGIDDIVIITKAYGGNLQGAKLVSLEDKACEVGDESLVLAPFVKVVAAKKIKDALPILQSLKPRIIITDDGMQNPSFHKDIIILTIDSNRAIGNGRLIPSGPLREYPKSAFLRSDCIILVGNGDDNENISKVIELPLEKPIFKAEIKMSNNLDKEKQYFAFTAIGNPSRFYEMLKENNLKITATQSFPDHYQYKDNDVEKLQQAARKLNCKLLTTRKDIVKISQKKDKIEVAEASLILENEGEFFALLTKKVVVPRNRTGS